MTKTMIWGTKCSCGADCATLQTDHHPWETTDYSIKITCLKCGKENLIDQKKAADFYSQHILRMFDKIKGSVLDFGCGSGLLSRAANLQPEVNDIYALDIDAECKSQILKINDKITFINGSVEKMVEQFAKQSIDELISRDVIMFLPNLHNFIKETTILIRHRVRILAWFKPDDKRVKNQFSPQEIKRIFQEHDWQVKLSFPNCYAQGYFINATH
jgi:cyclopropane fatty-acyl-phospholipid synthase-like methyltransferase